MKEPRSVYIAFEVFPRPKGASSHIASMVTAMAAVKGPVLLLCLGLGDLPAFQQEGGIQIRRCKDHHPNMLRRTEIFHEFVTEHLQNLGKKLDLCVFRDPWGGVPALLSRSFRTTVFEVNALPSWELEYTYPGFTSNPPLKHKIQDLERFCLSGCDRVLTVSPVTKRALSQMGVPPEKISTVPNSAPDFFFNPPSMDEATFPEIFSKGRLIGYVGSLHSWQGVDDAISAFSLIAGSFPDVNMMIIGTGRKESVRKVKRQIRKNSLTDRVLFHHPVSPLLLSNYLRRFDFTLAPLKDTPRNTHQGCCPVKIIESMAAGVPVIASDLASVRALMTHDREGLLVSPGHVRGFALAMARLIENRQLARQLGKNAADKALSEYSRQHIHRKLALSFNSHTPSELSERSSHATCGF